VHIIKLAGYRFPEVLAAGDLVLRPLVLRHDYPLGPAPQLFYRLRRILDAERVQVPFDMGREENAGDLFLDTVKLHHAGGNLGPVLFPVCRRPVRLMCVSVTH
jgi:hypothetical protein